jgi:hypothetical protein
MSTSYSRDSELEQLVTALADNQENITTEILLGSIAERVANNLEVKTNEMAIGPDFSAGELGKALAWCKPPGKHLAHLPTGAEW